MDAPQYAPADSQSAGTNSFEFGYQNDYYDPTSTIFAVLPEHSTPATPTAANGSLELLVYNNLGTQAARARPLWEEKGSRRAGQPESVSTAAPHLLSPLLRYKQESLRER